MGGLLLSQEHGGQMDALKLVALDREDLQIVSAHVQDAVMKVGDLHYKPREKRFVVAMNRYAWEDRGGLFRRKRERRNAVLHFDRVLAARTHGIDPARPNEVLSLLAVTFAPGEAPAGIVELAFSGGGTIRLDVECIEVRLSDLGAAWQASSTPVHRT
ncbi:hypothetical protein RHIZO_00277 [Rhizobiaceae bacterium]|nr:hypothetical protein RHIZO_00277 [Rhizobiaceae bacterium]